MVPNDFHGGVEVIPHQIDGLHPVWSGKTVTLTIPESGILKLAGDDPFSHWHQIKAQSLDGRPIRHFGHRSDNPGRATAMIKQNTYVTWCGTVASSHRASPSHELYVGPPEECELAEQVPRSDITPSGPLASARPATPTPLEQEQP